MDRNLLSTLPKDILIELLTKTYNLGSLSINDIRMLESACKKQLSTEKEKLQSELSKQHNIDNLCIVFNVFTSMFDFYSIREPITNDKYLMGLDLNRDKYRLHVGIFYDLKIFDTKEDILGNIKEIIMEHIRNPEYIEQFLNTVSKSIDLFLSLKILM